MSGSPLNFCKILKIVSLYVDHTDHESLMKNIAEVPPVESRAAIAGQFDEAVQIESRVIDGVV